MINYPTIVKVPAALRVQDTPVYSHLNMWEKSLKEHYRKTLNSEKQVTWLLKLHNKICQTDTKDWVQILSWYGI